MYYQIFGDDFHEGDYSEDPESEVILNQGGWFKTKAAAKEFTLQELEDMIRSHQVVINNILKRIETIQALDIT